MVCLIRGLNKQELVRSKDTATGKLSLKVTLQNPGHAASASPINIPAHCYIRYNTLHDMNFIYH